MSILQTKDQEFAVDLAFITKRRLGRENFAGERIPIDTGVISYLEIEENLLDMGYRGSVCIKNPFQILDKLQAINTTEDTLFIDINIEDRQTSTSKPEDRCLSFLGLIENSGAMSENIVNNELLFKFEEAQSSLLKKTSLYQLNKAGPEPLIPKENIQIGKYLRILISKWAEEAQITDPIHPDSLNFFKDNNGKYGQFRSFWQNVDESVYDVLYKLSENILINDKGSELLPILKIESYNRSNEVSDSSTSNVDKVDRVFTFKEVFTERHREFLRGVMAGDISGNYSDVYQEEFTLSPENPVGASTSFQNTIENYELLKTDVEAARELWWGDYIADNGPVNPTRTNISIERMPIIVDSLEKDDYGNIENVNCAVPVLDNIERKLFEADRGIHTEESSDIIRDFIWNRVKRSIIMLGDTVVFNVDGRMFRKPGKFITINGGDVFGKNPNNIWLVISVRHIFKELVYENEIIAVRLFGNEKRYLEYFPDIAIEQLLLAPIESVVNANTQSVPGQRQSIPVDSSVQLTSTNLAEFVKSKEGFVTTVVPDYGNNSIGYGTKATRSEIVNNTPISRAEADRRLDAELAYARGEVIKREQKYGYTWNDNQRDALTSFTFNAGPGNLDRLITGDTGQSKRSNNQIADKMLLYNKAGGNTLNGLTTRRQQEREIFINGYRS